MPFELTPEASETVHPSEADNSKASDTPNEEAKSRDISDVLVDEPMEGISRHEEQHRWSLLHHYQARSSGTWTI